MKNFIAYVYSLLPKLALIIFTLMFCWTAYLMYSKYESDKERLEVYKNEKSQIFNRYRENPNNIMNERILTQKTEDIESLENRLNNMVNYTILPLLMGITALALFYAVRN